MNTMTQEAMVAPKLLDYVVSEIQIEESGVTFILEHRFKDVSNAWVEGFIEAEKSTQTYTHSDGYDIQNDVDVEIDSLVLKDKSLATVLTDVDAILGECVKFMLTEEQFSKIDMLIGQYFEELYEEDLKRLENDHYWEWFY